MADVMSPAEACLNGIVDLYLSAARSGTDAAIRSSYTESLKLLEAYVVSELKARSVANARADSDVEHLREAADLLRNMVSSDAGDIDRLQNWYIRDRERGAAHPKKYADDPGNGGGS